MPGQGRQCITGANDIFDLKHLLNTCNMNFETIISNSTSTILDILDDGVAKNHEMDLSEISIADTGHFRYLILILIIIILLLLCVMVLMVQKWYMSMVHLRAFREANRTVNFI